MSRRSGVYAVDPKSVPEHERRSLCFAQAVDEIVAGFHGTWEKLSETLNAQPKPTTTGPRPAIPNDPRALTRACLRYPVARPGRWALIQYVLRMSGTDARRIAELRAEWAEAYWEAYGEHPPGFAAAALDVEAELRELTRIRQLLGRISYGALNPLRQSLHIEYLIGETSSEDRQRRTQRIEAPPNERIAWVTLGSTEGARAGSRRTSVIEYSGTGEEQPEVEIFETSSASEKAQRLVAFIFPPLEPGSWIKLCLEVDQPGVWDPMRRPGVDQAFYQLHREQEDFEVSWHFPAQLARTRVRTLLHGNRDEGRLTVHDVSSVSYRVTTSPALGMYRWEFTPASND